METIKMLRREDWKRTHSASAYTPEKWREVDEKLEIVFVEYCTFVKNGVERICFKCAHITDIHFHICLVIKEHQRMLESQIKLQNLHRVQSNSIYNDIDNIIQLQ